MLTKKNIFAIVMLAIFSLTLGVAVGLSPQLFQGYILGENSLGVVNDQRVVNFEEKQNMNQVNNIALKQTSNYNDSANSMPPQIYIPERYKGNPDLGAMTCSEREEYTVAKIKELISKNQELQEIKQGEFNDGFIDSEDSNNGFEEVNNALVNLDENDLSFYLRGLEQQCGCTTLGSTLKNLGFDEATINDYLIQEGYTACVEEDDTGQIPPTTGGFSIPSSNPANKCENYRTPDSVCEGYRKKAFDSLKNYSIGGNNSDLAEALSNMLKIDTECNNFCAKTTNTPSDGGFIQQKGSRGMGGFK